MATRSPGEFCWINMLTPQPDEARTFFSGVLGWTFFEMPGMGHGIKVGGRDIGGLFDLNGPNTPPGTPAHIGVMIKVENLESTLAQIMALGGAAEPPMEIGPAGRMAVCHDPNGAEFDLWQPLAMQGTDVDASLHGAPSWFETITTDDARATAFYTSLFGWTPQLTNMGAFSYTSFMQDGIAVAGMMPRQPDMGDMPTDWRVYFSVHDTDAAAATAAALGGTVCVPPTDIPNIGRFAGIISPQGVMFYVIKDLPR